MPTARVLDALQVLVPPADDGSDDEYLHRYLGRNDEAAFAELVRRHGSMVHGACRRILANGSDTDDAFQATFFVLARKAGTIRGNVRSWLYGVAVRVACKARTQAVARRVRQMAAAKPEAVFPAPASADLWVVLDEELAKLPDDLRQVVLACDVNGLSNAQAAREFGCADSTIVKRLARAHAMLARRLTRRGISLGAGALAMALSERAGAAVPAALLLETSRQALAFAAGARDGSPAVQALAEAVMRSIKAGTVKAWLVVGLMVSALAGGGFMLAEGPGARPVGKPDKVRVVEPNAVPLWKERYRAQFPGALPVSLAYSPDGQVLLQGDTAGVVTALTFAGEEPTWPWKATVGGTHAAVAYAPDGKAIYATTTDGVRILDAEKGQLGETIEAKASHPISLGVFPDKVIAPGITQSQIVFGNASGYFVKRWAVGKLPDSIGTIETSTAGKGTKPPDPQAVPLAVDPKGRSAIMTGPRDGTGDITGAKDMNVLWAYVCGNYEAGSPGNRVLKGHAATVVAAAWAKDGGTALTGDASGRVIVWDATAMKERKRLELGGRVLALALAADGRRAAVCVRLKHGCEFYVWELAHPNDTPKTIHTEFADFGFEPWASLAFTPDGQRLAGCAIDKKWLQLLPKNEILGQVRVWELAAAPKAQRPPRHLYTKELPKGSSANFVIQHKHVMIAPSPKEGAIDYRDPRDGSILSRLVLGQYSIGRLFLSSDRRWMAVERHPAGNGFGVGVPSQDFVADIWDMNSMKRGASIPGVSRILDVGNERIAIVREKKIEIWDNATCKLAKSAPFTGVRIDAARFSPDGRLLALNDQNDLILWRWTEDTHERFALGRRIGSLAFSPDGKTLAEGPSPRDSIELRDMGTRKVVQSLRNGAQPSLDVPRMAFAQGGRLLIAANAIHLAKEIPVPHRIHFWDTLTGEVAHEIAIPSGLPRNLELTPDGRYLVATIEDKDGVKLSAWEIDGTGPVVAPPSGWREGKTIPSPNNGPVTGLAMSPDGKMLAVVANEQVAILDPTTGTRIDKGRIANMKVLPKHHGIAFSSRGKLAVTGAAGLNVFEDLLAELPRFTHGTTDAVPGFDPHQVVWIDDNFQTGMGRLLATDGHDYRAFGWTAKTVNGVEAVEKTIGARWTAPGAHTHEPTALAATPTRIVHTGAGPDGNALQIRFIEREPDTLRTLTGHGARPTTAVIAKDGSAIVSGDAGGTLIAWTGDGMAYSERKRWKLGGSLAALALAPDQRTVAALRLVKGNLDALAEVQFELFVFDLRESGDIRPIWRTPQGFPGQYALGAMLAFHPNGTKLYGAFGDPFLQTNNHPFGRSSGIRVWEKIPAPPADSAPPPAAPAPLSWKAETPISDPQFDIQSLAFSKVGSTFAIGSNGHTLVYDTTTLKKLYTVDGGFPRFVDDLLLTWALGVRKYDARTGKELKEFPRAKSESAWRLAAISPDGKLVAGVDGQRIHLVGVATGLESRFLWGQGPADIHFPFQGVAWSPDGLTLAAFEPSIELNGMGGLSIWNAASGQRLARRSAGPLEFNGPHACFAFAPDGKTIAVGGLTGDTDRNSSLTILDAATLKNRSDPIPVRSRDGGAVVTAVAISPDGATIAIAVKLLSGKGPLNRIQLYDAKTLELRESLLPPQDPAPFSTLAYAPDGRTLVAATGEGPFSDAQKRERLHRVIVWRGNPAR